MNSQKLSEEEIYKIIELDATELFFWLTETKYAAKVPKALKKQKHSRKLEKSELDREFLNFFRTMGNTAWFDKAKDAYYTGILKETSSKTSYYTKNEANIVITGSITDLYDYIYCFIGKEYNRKEPLVALLGKTPIFFVEMLLTDYLSFQREQYPEYGKGDLERYNLNYQLMKSEVDLHGAKKTNPQNFVNSASYVISTIIASNLYEQYQSGMNLNEIYQRLDHFYQCLLQNDINQAMQQVGIDMQVENKKLLYSNASMMRLIECYYKHYHRLFSQMEREYKMQDKEEHVPMTLPILSILAIVVYFGFGGTFWLMYGLFTACLFLGSISTSFIQRVLKKRVKERKEKLLIVEDDNSKESMNQKEYQNTNDQTLEKNPEPPVVENEFHPSEEKEFQKTKKKTRF